MEGFFHIWRVFSTYGGFFPHMEGFFHIWRVFSTYGGILSPHMGEFSPQMDKFFYTYGGIYFPHVELKVIIIVSRPFVLQ